MVGRPFQPGQSGNPTGRPKKDRTIEELAKSHTPTAMATLADICGDKDAPPAARVTAAVALLDRGWGKPRQDHDITHHLPAAGADDATLLAIALGGGGNGVAASDDPGEPGGVVH